MPKRAEGRALTRADPREIALEIVRRARVHGNDSYDGIPYVIRISDPMSASERLQLAAVRLLRRPVAIVPHKCATIDEWMERYGGLALGDSAAEVPFGIKQTWDKRP